MLMGANRSESLAHVKKEILPPDLHYLHAAQGWIGLGNIPEAEAELKRMKHRLMSHPDVLEVRWHIDAHKKEWEEAANLADALVILEPQRWDGWVHRSFAFHEMKRTREAFDKLLPAAEMFPEVWTIPYNLACYCIQLGRIKDGKFWFKKAVAIDENAALQSGREDADLKPLWDSMGGKV